MRRPLLLALALFALALFTVVLITSPETRTGAPDPLDAPPFESAPSFPADPGTLVESGAPGGPEKTRGTAESALDSEPGLAPEGAAARSPETGTISGRLTNVLGGAVAGARVLATRSDASTTGVVLRTTTDRAGKFHFRDLMPGEYRIEATRNGPRAVSTGVRVEAGRITRIKLRQPPTGSVLITVVDERGRALAGVRVSTGRPRAPDPGSTGPPPLPGLPGPTAGPASLATDAVGQCRFEGLPHGEHRFHAVGEDRRSDPISVLVAPGRIAEGRLVVRDRE